MRAQCAAGRYFPDPLGNVTSVMRDRFNRNIEKPTASAVGFLHVNFSFALPECRM